MKKLSSKYLDESTGITFEVIFENGKKHVKVFNNRNGKEFVFNTSKPETLIKVSSALLEIGTFCANMEVENTSVWKADYQANQFNL